MTSDWIVSQRDKSLFKTLTGKIWPNEHIDSSSRENKYFYRARNIKYPSELFYNLSEIIRLLAFWTMRARWVFVVPFTGGDIMLYINTQIYIYTYVCIQTYNHAAADKKASSVSLRVWESMDRWPPPRAAITPVNTARVEMCEVCERCVGRISVDAFNVVNHRRRRTDIKEK